MTTVIPPIMKDLIRKGRLGWVDEPFSGHAVLVERGTGCIIRDARNQKITGPKVPFRQTAPLNEQEFLDHARDRDIENDVDWMYQDHKGNVTIGIGHKVATAEDAVVLVAFFEDRDDPATPITDDAIRAAYLAVKQDPHTGKLFGHFETHTALRLKSLASSEIFHKDVDRILGELAAHSEYSPHKFETFPPDAKFAIMDMAFNMGAAGVAHVYSRFTAAVSRRNWALAATESDRPDLSPKRNKLSAHGWRMQQDWNCSSSTPTAEGRRPASKFVAGRAPGNLSSDDFLHHDRRRTEPRPARPGSTETTLARSMSRRER